MRLFSPKEIKKVVVNDEVRRSVTLKKLIKDNQEDLATLQARLDPKKRKLQEDFQLFFNQITNQKSALLKEVTDLEERQEKALIPLDAKWLELEERDISITSREESVSKREATVQSTQSQLEERIDFLVEKTDELAEQELDLRKQQQTAKEQASLLEGSTRDLNAKWEQFHLQANSKKLELLDHEKRNFDKEQALDVIKESLDKRENDLNDYKRQLDDRAATLERGFVELRTKQDGR
jgi:DNA repair exonuclease SbcCD ATPase subunit